MQPINMMGCLIFTKWKAFIFKLYVSMLARSFFLKQIKAMKITIFILFFCFFLKVIARIVDGSKFDEFKALYGDTLITGI